MFSYLTNLYALHYNSLYRWHFFYPPISLTLEDSVPFLSASLSYLFNLFPPNFHFSIYQGSNNSISSCNQELGLQLPSHHLLQWQLKMNTLLFCLSYFSLKFSHLPHVHVIFSTIQSLLQKLSLHFPSHSFVFFTRLLTVVKKASLIWWILKAKYGKEVATWTSNAPLLINYSSLWALANWHAALMLTLKYLISLVMQGQYHLFERGDVVELKEQGLLIILDINK